jgi:hypothetical protein
MPAVLKVVKAYATVGEIANVWHKVYRIWSYPMGIQKLGRISWKLAFAVV